MAAWPRQAASPGAVSAGGRPDRQRGRAGRPAGRGDVRGAGRRRQAGWASSDAIETVGRTAAAAARTPTAAASRPAGRPGHCTRSDCRQAPWIDPIDGCVCTPPRSALEQAERQAGQRTSETRGTSSICIRAWSLLVTQTADVASSRLVFVSIGLESDRLVDRRRRRARAHGIDELATKRVVV
ncbi:hypothetical protein PVAP13_4NG034000 [Panicum virgatum]|uniref:Uncharacterized protein n=1 Tax=Panicum virgatum TaxID=38727 RepID=A0A8T0SYY6_PANVG|nr:hypothetical protein PVAP13_4NG034000 [Panicum virgatum]